MSNKFNTPVLFLVFNRLDTTKQVFEAIRKAAPPRLYVASDGPRETREGEKEKVEEVREYIIGHIDWDCEVKTLFREKNLGCGKAVSGAITWFFENEEMGIILEDDCLPVQSFFMFCGELLKKYKDDERIYSIAGNNPLTFIKSPYSYYFARIPHIWGWASWRRAWNRYSFDIVDLDDFLLQKKIKRIFDRIIDQKYFIDLFKKMEKHEIDTWDCQWAYTGFINEGLAIIPTANLITNIGFRADATHTINPNSVYNNQQRFEITKIVHTDKIEIDNRIINRINVTAYGLNWFNCVKIIIKTLFKIAPPPPPIGRIECNLSLVQHRRSVCVNYAKAA